MRHREASAFPFVSVDEDGDPLADFCGSAMLRCPGGLVLVFVADKYSEIAVAADAGADADADADVVDAGADSVAACTAVVAVVAAAMIAAVVVFFAPIQPPRRRIRR